MNFKMLMQFYIASFVAHTQTLLLQMKHNRPFYLFTGYVVYISFCLYYSYSIVVIVLPLVLYLLTFLIDTYDHPHTYYMKQSPFAVKVLATTPQLGKDYQCAVKPMSGHILTSYFSSYTPTYEQKLTREIVTLEDGGICGLDYLECDLPENAPIIFVLPGILGDAKQPYSKKIMQYALENGMRSVVHIKRGLDGLELKTDRMFSAISVDDAFECLKLIHQKYPQAYINVIGYSLGGAQAVRLSYVYSEKLLEYKVNAICAICPIWGISSVSPPTLYEASHVEYIKEIIMKNKHLFENKMNGDKKVYDMEAIKKCRIFKDIEREVLTPMFGYNHVNSYYWDVEQWFQNLPVTHIPTYTLTSFDDPVLNDQSYSYLRIKALSGFSPFVINSYTQRGGHCIYTESFDQNASSYADKNCMAFIQTVMNLNASGVLDSMRKEVQEKFKWFNE